MTEMVLVIMKIMFETIHNVDSFEISNLSFKTGVSYFVEKEFEVFNELTVFKILMKVFWKYFVPLGQCQRF